MDRLLTCPRLDIDTVPDELGLNSILHCIRLVRIQQAQMLPDDLSSKELEILVGNCQEETQAAVAIRQQQIRWNAQFRVGPETCFALPVSSELPPMPLYALIVFYKLFQGHDQYKSLQLMQVLKENQHYNAKPYGNHGKVLRTCQARAENG